MGGTGFGGRTRSLFWTHFELGMSTRHVEYAAGYNEFGVHSMGIVSGARGQHLAFR